MSSHMQLTRAAAGNQAADLQHYAAQQAPEQCGQLWTQLQELMQQRWGVSAAVAPVGAC